MLKISDGVLTVAVNLDRGAEIAQIFRKDDGVNALAYGEWRSPIAAGGVTSYYDPTLDWLSGYRGGWQETLPNAGLASELDGMPLPLHGEGSVIPWHLVEASDSSCLLATDLRPTLRASRRLSIRGAVLHVESEVANTGVLPVPMVWGHHPAFAANSETMLHLPSTRYTVEETQRDGLDAASGTWPLASIDGGKEVDLSSFGSNAGQRLVYCSGHDDGWAVIRQGATLPHVAMSWDVEAYPAIWVWQNRRDPSFPWFGRLECLGVEPQRAWPFDGLAGARSRRQELVVAPGRSVTAWVTVSLPSALPEEIIGVTRSGQVLGGPAGQQFLLA